MRGKLLIAIAGTGAAAYFLDPDQGKRRRHLAKDRVGGFFRQHARTTKRAARTATGYGEAFKERAKARVREERPPGDDVTLKNKIETELFREPDAPKGSVNIDVADGIVTLRGQVDRPEQVHDLEAKVEREKGKTSHQVLQSGTVCCGENEDRASANRGQERPREARCRTQSHNPTIRIG